MFRAGGHGLSLRHSYRRNFRSDNLLRALQGGVRLKRDGRASRGDVVRLVKLVGAEGAYQAWRKAAEKVETLLLLLSLLPLLFLPPR